MIEQVPVIVVVPAHNEEEFIQNVIETLPDFVDNIIVVDDHSTDETQHRVAEVKSTTNLVVITSKCRGVGAAIDSGFEYALKQFEQPFICVVVAGDGQMDPNDMEELIQPILQGQADYVKGNRKIHADGLNKMPLHRKVASSILSVATTLASGKPVSDPQCGYCAVSSDVLVSWDFDNSWQGYGYPNFWLIRLSSFGFRVKEVPVRSVYNTSISGIRRLPFFLRVGWMMAVEHHRRNFSWLLGSNRTPHTFFAFIAYALGWTMFLPFETNLEIELVNRGIDSIVLGLICWTIAHVFDRLSSRTQERMRLHGQRR
jgi:dolichol-phosphate mannosyltransferase